MLTIEDCIALSTLTRDEIDAIAEDQHIPEMVAAELGAYLLQLPDGEKRISSLIRHDLEEARRCGDLCHAAKLRLVLRHFLDEHAAPQDSSLA